MWGCCVELKDVVNKDRSTGSLVKLRVVDIIGKSKISKAFVSPDTRLVEVRKIIRDEALRSIAVVDSDGKLIGIITRGSVLSVASSKSEAMASSVAEPPMVILRPDVTLGEAIKSMLKADEWASPVVDSNGRFLGFLTFDDIVQLMINCCAENLKSVSVSDVMSTNVVAVSEEDFISKIWNRIRELRYAGLPVVDSSGRLVGMITQYDLIAKGYSRIHLESEGGASRGPRVKDVMSRNVTYLYPWSSLYEVASLMAKHSYGRVPIVNNSKELKLVGIVDREDVVKSLAR
jgi:CBS domain-containing protein